MFRHTIPFLDQRIWVATCLHNVSGPEVICIFLVAGLASATLICWSPLAVLSGTPKTTMIDDDWYVWVKPCKATSNHHFHLCLALF